MRHLTLPAVVVGLALGACTEQPLAPAPTVRAESPDPHVSGDLVTTFTGDIGPGSSYEILVPPVWNGDLVLYAHGYVDPAGGDPVTDGERAFLLSAPALGYAVAFSTYSRNGLVLKDAMQRTKQLRGIFVRDVGRPKRTYLVGASMGGLVAVGLAERFPEQYDGTLAVCGMVGGTQAQIDYVSHVRVLFDYFFPGVLPGGLFDAPPLSAEQVAVLVVGAVAGEPLKLVALNSVMTATLQRPLPGTTPDQIVASLVSALTFDVRGYSDVLGQTHGHSPFDNSSVAYVGTGSPLLDAALNDPETGVARFRARPDATHYLAKYYEPSGVLRAPVLTVHNLHDPVVPLFHEGRLGAAAAAAGYEGSLVRGIAATSFGHCAFTVQELAGAFGALVAWVELGVKPGGP